MGMGKRGVSPLIATILLIAFAIAIGAVVMNLPSILPEMPFESQCGVNVGLEIVEIGGEPRACYSASQSLLKFTLTNSGGVTDIDDLHLTIFGGKDVFNMDNVITEKIPKADSREITVKYEREQYGEIQKVQITPKIMSNGELVLCANSRIELENIPGC